MKAEKKLLITGASSEMGVALIERVYKEYGTIVAHYNRNSDLIANVKPEIREKIIPVQADFSDPDSVDAMIAEIKEKEIFPDHIVHLAASKCINEKIAKLNIDRYKTDFQVSVLSVLSILKAFAPRMAKQKYGKIVLMLSSYTVQRPPKYVLNYASLKYSLLGIVKVLAEEMAGKGVTVNGISPAMIETKFLNDLPELIVEKNAASNPRGKNLQVDEVVPVIEFLLSSAADCITGENLAVTAGGN